MGIIQDKEKDTIRKKLEALDNPVRIVNFTQEFECAYCRETRQLVEEIAELSGNLSVEVHDFAREKEEVEKYGIDKIPATVLVGDKDYGIRYFGIPSGYEFSTLLDDIVMVSRRDSGLTEGSRELLAGVSEPAHLQVFVTPT